MAAPLEDGPNTPEETNAILSGLGAKPKAAGVSNPRGFRRQNPRKATLAKSKKGLSTGVLKVSDNQELVKPGTVYGTLSYDENGIAEAQRRNPVARINNTLKEQGVGVKMPQVSAKGAKKAKASKALGDEYTDEVGPKGQADPFQAMTNLANDMQRNINAHRQLAGGTFGGDFGNAESILRAVHAHVMSAQGAHNAGKRVSAGDSGYQENYPYKSAHPDDSILSKTYAEGEEIPGEHLTPAQAQNRTPETAHDHLDMAAKLLGHTGKFLHDLTEHTSNMPGAKEIPKFENNYQGTGQSHGTVANNIADEYRRSGGGSADNVSLNSSTLDTGRVRREDAHTAIYEAPAGRTINDRLFPGVNNRGRDTVMQFALAEAKKHEDAIGYSTRGAGKVTGRFNTGAPMGPSLPAPTGSAFQASEGSGLVTRSAQGEEPRVKGAKATKPVTRTRRSDAPEPVSGAFTASDLTESEKASAASGVQESRQRFADAQAASKARLANVAGATGDWSKSKANVLTQSTEPRGSASEEEMAALRVRGDAMAKKSRKKGRGIGGGSAFPTAKTYGVEAQLKEAKKAPTRGDAAVTETDMNYVNQALQQGDVGRAAALHWRASNTLPADNPVTSSRRYAESKIAENPKAYLKEAGVTVPKRTGRSRGAFDAARGQ